MKTPIFASVASLILSATPAAWGAYIITLSSDDIAISSVYNNITSFEFEIVGDGTLTAGTTYTNPSLTSVEYRVNGSLPNPTPSGFPAFALTRSLTGTEFYNQSPDSGITFTIRNTADLSDGLQVSELDGTGTVFTLNARELNQAPGRYHPPIFTLNDDGTGRLTNANNMSTVPNPDPPIGSGMLVDVEIAEEYDTSLSFAPSLTIGTVPEPSASALILAAALACTTTRRRRPLPQQA